MNVYVWDFTFHLQSFLLFLIFQEIVLVFLYIYKNILEGLNFVVHLLKIKEIKIGYSINEQSVSKEPFFYFPFFSIFIYLFI